MKNWISNIAAVLWFFGVLVWWLLLLPLTIIMLPTNDISSILKSGFAIPTSGFEFMFCFGLFFGITMLVPAFRKCFHKLPWLYPYITILTADATILCVGLELLNYGYQVQSNSRHILFLILTIILTIALRVAMCIYFYRKPTRKERKKHEQ